ncbi:Fur family transcriptional regulator [Planctomycetota bacterium]
MIKQGTDEVRIQEKMKGFLQCCKAAGLKITPQRLAVYRYLLQTQEHPSAEMLHRQLRTEHPNISLDTVNRTLLTLAEMGVAFVVEGTGEPKRFDADTRNHQHFRCLQCKRVVDFHHAPFDDVPVPQALQQGFQVKRKTVYFEGICDHCGAAH